MLLGHHRGVDLCEREARMVQEDLPCVSQFNAVNATRQQLGPDLVFEVSDLSAEGGL